MSAAHKEANSTSPIAQESHSIFFTESQDPLEYIASVKEIFHRPDQIAYISLIFLLGQVYFAKYEVIEARTNPENLPSFSSSYFSQTEGEIVLHRSVANTVIRLCNEVFFSLQKTQKAVSQMKESYIEKRMNAFQDESVLGKIQLLPFLLMQKVLLGEKKYQQHVEDNFASSYEAHLSEAITALNDIRETVLGDFSAATYTRHISNLTQASYVLHIDRVTAVNIYSAGKAELEHMKTN